MRENINKPILDQCRAAGFIASDKPGTPEKPNMKEIAKDAIKGRGGYTIENCSWEGQPKYFGTSCGIYCTGLATCTYKVGNYTHPPVKRMIGCRGSMTASGANCGDATKCHKEKINFADAAGTPVGEAKAPAEASSSGAGE
jgi:hypothetical protein